MADTPRRGRSRGASPARSPATPANAYWLRNRTPRELAALGSPALPDTPTYNLRNRVVARDEPPPRRMSTSERLADALARAKAASVDFTVVAWEAGVRGVRRTVRWWNGAGWALRAAMACWAVALVLAFFPTRMFSSNKDIIVPTTDATEELPQCGVDEEASPGLLAGDGTDFMSLATNATRAAAATAAAPAKPSSIPLFTLIEPQPASLGQAYAADPIIVPPELPKPKPRIISEHTQLASVVSDKTSPTFVLNAPGRISTWIGDLYEWAIGKRLVLAAGGSPDAVLQGAPSCWPMKGGELLFPLLPSISYLTLNHSRL